MSNRRYNTQNIPSRMKFMGGGSSNKKMEQLKKTFGWTKQKEKTNETKTIYDDGCNEGTEVMAEQQGRKAQEKGPKKAGLASAPKKEKGPFDLPKDQKIYVITGFNGKEFEAQNMAKGGRVNLRGGGICKRGMNKKAYGRNS